MLSVIAHHENPYDGATLKECLKKAEENAESKITHAFADKAYRGKSHHPEEVEVLISGRKNLKVGDKINAILSGCAFNLLKMIRLINMQQCHLN